MATTNDPTSQVNLGDDGVTRQPKHETNRLRRNWRTTADLVDADHPYSVGANDDLVLVTLTSAGLTVTFPASPTTGRVIGVKAMTLSGQTVTVDGNGKNIDGSGTTTITANYKYLEALYDGAEWAVLGDTR